MAVGRDNQVDDVVAQASSRPPAALSREWQPATANQNIRPSASAAISPAAPPDLVALGPVGTPVLLQYVLPGGQSKQAEVVLQSLEQPLERALIGSGEAGQTAEPPSLVPAPLMTRRVEPATAYRVTEPDPLVRVEELLGRLNNRLEQIERRLERLEPGR